MFLGSVFSLATKRRRAGSLVLTLALFALGAPSCLAEWKKTITCPAGHEYQVEEHDAGAEEYCILHLSGSLVVKDGPYESWFDKKTAGSVGQYSMGRQVGAWTECNRFLHCEKQQYETVFPREKLRPSFRPVVPVTFENGKYSIDFASCRSTWITQTIRPDPVSLNIDGDKLYRCQISYLPQSSESGGGGDYSCEVPFTVGRREFSTLDLRKELHQLGFPEFCYEKFPTDALLVRDGVWNVANARDIECAAVGQDASGSRSLKIRLNRYASRDVQQVAGKAGAIDSLLCFHSIPGPAIAVDSRGKPTFSFPLGRNTKDQQACLAKLSLQKTCE